MFVSHISLFALLGSKYKSRDQVSCYVSKMDFTSDKDETNREGKVMLHCVLLYYNHFKQFNEFDSVKYG